MPELPDVEVFKRYLDATALHQEIADVKVRNSKVLAVSRKRLTDALKGCELKSTRRHGKHLLVQTDGGTWLVLHFGMTGRLAYFKHDDDEPAHCRLRLDFANGYRLAYDSQRMIGKVSMTEDPEDYIRKNKLGPDALEIDAKTFRAILNGRRGSIKTTLMNQELLAGIGNVYSDEILYQAEIDPRVTIDELDEDDVERLYRKMRSVLAAAVDFKADPHEAPRTWMLAHRGKGGQCPRCGREFKQIKVGGRTAYICQLCQSTAMSVSK